MVLPHTWVCFFSTGECFFAKCSARKKGAAAASVVPKQKRPARNEKNVEKTSAETNKTFL